MNGLAGRCKSQDFLFDPFTLNLSMFHSIEKPNTFFKAKNFNSLIQLDLSVINTLHIFANYGKNFKYIPSAHT